MNDLTILYILLSLLIVLVIILFIIVIKSNSKNNDLKNYIDHELKNKQNSDQQWNIALNKNINDLSVSLNKDLLDFNTKLANNFNLLNDRLAKNLNDSNKTNQEVFTKISEKMVKINETQEGLKELSNEIVSLESILQDKKTRGTFGEIELYSLLESSFGTNPLKFQKQYKLSNGHIADAVVFGGENFNLICIDSKFPLENYRRIYDENNSKEQTEGYRKAFKNDVSKHIKDIKDRYIIPGETCEMAFMFVPAEAVFAEIFSNCVDVVDRSYEAKVYIVSPTTLMAYLTAIRSIYLGQRKDEKAKEIEKLLAELSLEFKRLEERQADLQRDFLKIGPDFEDINITTTKIIKKFNKINSVEFDD